LDAIFQIQDCGMVLEEQPGKVSEAFRLFLQGQGYGKCSTPQ
jgi:Ndr family